MITFCREAGCGKPAVGGHLTAKQIQSREASRGAGGQPDVARLALPNDLCRGHLQPVIDAQAVTCKVVGPLAVVGVDGAEVDAPGLVRLHPAQTDIAALQYMGLVEPAEAPPAASSGAAGAKAAKQPAG